jgi:hypothetical protein
MRRDFDAAVAEPHRKGAPMGTVGETSGGESGGQVHAIRLIG